MMHATRRRLVALLVSAALPLSSACGASSSSTSTVAPSPVTRTESFTSTLDQLGSVTNGFTVAAAGTVQVKLTDVEPLTTMALGVAVTTVTSGTICSGDIAQNTNAKSGTTALSGNAAVGSYCVRVFDAGNIPVGTEVTYTVEVTHP